MSVAEEDGNHLADAWEHVLTCISRFEHLHQIGEGVMTDAALFSGSRLDAKKPKPGGKPARRSHLPHDAIQSGAIKRGSYDSAGVGGNAAGPVTSEQINTLVSNLGLLEQIDSTEINRIFTKSEKLNSEAIVEFVKALIKVSLDELRSPTEPRIFSLTKIVEIS
jgi:brefeldin A-inhibited guanine nucleotide-exchange protein